MEFLYLPSTSERTLSSIGEDSIEDSLTNFSLTTRKVQSTTTVSPRRVLTIPKAPPTCSPMTVDFCLKDNMTLYESQRHLSETQLAEMRSVVNSKCHPFASHFLCAWGVRCNGPVTPCSNYCEEFLDSCKSVLSPHLRASIQCEGLVKQGSGSCIPKPGCVEGLYRSGQGHRVW